MTAPRCPPRAGTSPADHPAAARGSHGPDGLRRPSATPYPFVWQALAENPHTPTDALVLSACARSDERNDQRPPPLSAERPGTGGEVFWAVLRAAATLPTADARPCTAALTPTRSPGANPNGVTALRTPPGASARLRRGPRRRLAVRASGERGPR